MFSFSLGQPIDSHVSTNSRTLPFWRTLNNNSYVAIHSQEVYYDDGKKTNNSSTKPFRYGGTTEDKLLRNKQFHNIVNAQCHKSSNKVHINIMKQTLTNIH